MAAKYLFAVAVAIVVHALPQGGAPSGSPIGADCTFHEDHWDCVTPCATVTRTRLGIDATITDWPAWQTSMNSVYSTPGISWSGSTVFVHTSVYHYPGGSFTGYGVFDSHAVTRAGYNIVSELITTTSCQPTVTPGPSPTESYGWHCDGPRTSDGQHTTAPADEECEAHDDHWHCPPGVSEPTTVPGQPSSTFTPPTLESTSQPIEEECEAHDDHWHCPPGAPEPTSLPKQGPTASAPPAIASTTQAIDEECGAHNGHWHCPPGVPEPTSLPPADAPEQTSSDLHSSECEAGGDRWRCSSRIAKPTTDLPSFSVSELPPSTTFEKDCEPHGGDQHCLEHMPEPTSLSGSFSGTVIEGSPELIDSTSSPTAITSPTPGNFQSGASSIKPFPLMLVSLLVMVLCYR
ncbi:hypothetical protein HJFPF1_13457 [Paramyrothecium foliicola]|nr:hypothetical protein HJFPF1_13457 [Paramyrothecium foliicola]